MLQRVIYISCFPRNSPALLCSHASMLEDDNPIVEDMRNPLRFFAFATLALYRGLKGLRATVGRGQHDDD